MLRLSLSVGPQSNAAGAIWPRAGLKSELLQALVFAASPSSLAGQAAIWLPLFIERVDWLVVLPEGANQPNQ